MSLTDNEIIDIILENSPEEAIEELMDIYEDPIENAFTIYNRWKRLRSLMMRDPRFQNRSYERDVQVLIDQAVYKEPTGFDVSLLRNLLLSTTLDRHKINMFTQRSTFKNREVFFMFKRIKPFIREFYEFQLPDELIDEKDIISRDNNLLKQMHQKSRANIFSLSQKKIREWRQSSLDIIRDTANYTKRNIGLLIAAIQILSGRRLIEIVGHMNIICPGPTEYSAYVSNLAKKKLLFTAERHSSQSDERVLIPLLCKFNDFKNVIMQIRSLEEFTGAVRPYIFTKTSKATVEAFKEKLDHTVKRNIYCELCWIEKNIHQCHMACSKKAFFGIILGHDLHFDATDQYASVVITA